MQIGVDTEQMPRQFIFLLQATGGVRGLGPRKGIWNREHDDN